MNKRQRGFTFVEVLVVAPIVILAIGSFIALIIVMSGNVLAARAQNVLTYDIQDALTRMEHDIKSSSRFLATNSFALSSPQGSNNATAAFKNIDTTAGPALILEQTATNENPARSPSSFTYLRNQPNSCSNPSLRENTRMTYNVVYFIKDSSLWRRTLMPSAYLTAGCAVPWQKPTCTTVSGFCTALDSELVKGVTINDFSVQYYTTSNSTTPDTNVTNTSNSDSVRGATLETLNSANVALRATTPVAGRDVTWSASLRATRIP